jgi:heptosyltransferase-2/heptosyltransferase-3
MVPIVIRFGRLGDMVMLTSLLHVLQQRYGRPCEVFAAGPWNEPLYAEHPDVARLWTLGRHTPSGLGLSWWRAWWQLRRSDGRPVYVGEYQPRQLRRIRRLLRLAGVPAARCLFITQDLSDVQSHWVDRLARFGARTPAALARSPAIAAGPGTAPAPRLFVSAAELEISRAWLARQGWVGRELILIQPGNFRTMSARREHYRHSDDKAWPLEDWVSLMRRLAAARPEAVQLLCGAPPEAPLLEEIARAAQLPHAGVAALPLRPFLALCRLAHSMISIDTGPAHAAAALGVPLTVMYGAEAPQQWLPRSPTGSAVLAVGGPPRTRVAQLSVEEVFQCWQAAIAGGPSPDLRM